MVYKRFAVVLGMFMANQVRAAGQTPLPHIVSAQEHGHQIMEAHRIVSSLLPTARLLLSPDFGGFPPHFNLSFARGYAPDPSLDHFSPIDKVKAESTQAHQPSVKDLRALTANSLRLTCAPHVSMLGTCQR